MNNQELPLIRKISEVGETPFQFVEKKETILQGWHAPSKKNVFLFKNDQGQWSNYDSAVKKVVPVTQWDGKSAMINGAWVKLAIYHRINLLFVKPITYSAWDASAKKEVKAQTQEAIVVVTDTAYKLLCEQLNGRDPMSFLKFGWTSKNVGGRQMTYVDKVLWVNPSTIQ